MLETIAFKTNMRVYILLTPLLIALLLSCANNPEKQNTTTLKGSKNAASFDSTKYNLEIRPTAKIECTMLNGRAIDTTIENQPYYLDTTDFYRFKSGRGMNHRQKMLWPCNIPDLLQPGDTVLVSAILYNVYGDEGMPGIPAIITKILLHDKYKNGLSELYRK